MSDKPENGLKQELDRRKRINRIKSIIVSFVGIWMLASVILCATLFVKVIHLENNLNKVLQNMPQVEQVENEETKNSPDADTGKNVEYGKQDQTGQDDANKKKADDGEKLKVYLTFDDGPNSYTTPKILKILKKNNVKATFFELRPASYDYKLTKRVIDEGHTLALHGFKHKYYEIYKSEKVYKGNLDKLRNLFFKKFGVWCTVSRFPGGSSNTVSRYNKGIMTRLTKKLDGWGYHYFDWNVDSEDAGGARNPQQTFHNVTSELCKGRGNVVLMHDFYGNDKTINALDKMIKYGKKHGYVFLPITASTDAVHHGVNN